MNLKGLTVIHKTEGKGTITDFYEKSNRFNVKYDSGTEKPYQYPDPFRYGVLKFEDPDMNAQVEKDIKVLDKKLTSFKKNGETVTGLKDTKTVPAKYEDPLTADELKHGISYGTTASSIYDALCKNVLFNWNKANRRVFTAMNVLYSYNCTEEGYAVWFIPYSSYTMNKQPDKEIVNNIIDGSNDIEELFDKERALSIRKNNEDLGGIVLAFVKNKFGQYEFWGVMKKTEISLDKPPYRIYNKLISKTYRP